MPAMVRPTVDIEAKRNEIQNEVEQIYADFERQELNNDQYDVVQRNILLVGPSKSGKTTLRHVLTDPRHVAEELSLRAVLQTESTTQRNIHLPSSKVTLNIVELPETMINSELSLLQINTECHRLGIQDFHLICLCASFDTGINGQVLRSFEQLIDYFGQKQVRSNLCLIVTRCESKDEEQREKLRKELREDIDYKRISKHFGREIHFSGALNRDDWNRANESLLDQFETVYQYRKNLLDIIRTDVQPFHIATQQREPPSISRNAQPHVPYSRQLKPLPMVRSDVNPLGQTYGQLNSPPEPDARTTLSKEPGRWARLIRFARCA